MVQTYGTSLLSVPFISVLETIAIAKSFCEYFYLQIIQNFIASLACMCFKLHIYIYIGYYFYFHVKYVNMDKRRAVPYTNHCIFLNLEHPVTQPCRIILSVVLWLLWFQRYMYVKHGLRFVQPFHCKL
jgi:hypothetical protein